MSPIDRRSPTRSSTSLCFDAATGRLVWTHQYACDYANVDYKAGPRAAVSVDGPRAYVLGTMGHLRCLNTSDGSVLWKKEPGVDYKVRVPIWGVAAAPLVDGEQLIVELGAGDGACLVALDKQTGAERWRALDDPAGYSAPIIIRQAGHRVLVCWTGTHVVGLDPASGKVHWREPFASA